jgi:hypothetical protein
MRYHAGMTTSQTNPSKLLREKGPLSFLAFAGQLISDESIVTDFIAIVKGDLTFPDANSWQELRRYLNKINATDAAFIGGRLAWRGYEAARKKRVQEILEVTDGATLPKYQ